MCLLDCVNVNQSASTLAIRGMYMCVLVCVIVCERIEITFSVLGWTVLCYLYYQYNQLLKLSLVCPWCVCGV